MSVWRHSVCCTHLMQTKVGQRRGALEPCSPTSMIYVSLQPPMSAPAYSKTDSGSIWDWFHYVKMVC